MNPNEPVDPRVRLAIADWPDDAPRGAVTTFCLEHGISRNTFYKIRNRALEHGQAAALEPRSRRPGWSPSTLTDQAKNDALRVRAALESSGLDHGPISVHDTLVRLGLTAPSTASLARVFREAGVARIEPKKRPRAAWRRFVYPAPNACWQLDATEYVLSRGRRCVIFQLTDDHSRLEVASLPAEGETGDAAVRVLQTGIAARGVPQRLLTDNGRAMNQTRQGYENELVEYAKSLGITPITGKPYRPTTQGKNERAHQTLFRWLDQQPLADSLDQLQEQLDRFREVFNTQRGHQGLPGIVLLNGQRRHMTPQEAWDATPVAQAPRPLPDAGPARGLRQRHPAGTATRIVASNGTITVTGVRFRLGKAFVGTRVEAVWDEATVSCFDEQGTQVAEFVRPEPGVKAVGNGRPRGFLARISPE